jgi:hypothetical protein
MLKQKVSSTKKVLSILLAVLFVVSLTVIVVSAADEYVYKYQSVYPQSMGEQPVVEQPGSIITYQDGYPNTTGNLTSESIVSNVKDDTWNGS